MKAFVTLAAAAALLTGATVASYADDPGTPNQFEQKQNSGNVGKEKGMSTTGSGMTTPRATAPTSSAPGQSQMGNPPATGADKNQAPDTKAH